MFNISYAVGNIDIPLNFYGQFYLPFYEYVIK